MSVLASCVFCKEKLGNNFNTFTHDGKNSAFHYAHRGLCSTTIFASMAAHKGECFICGDRFSQLKVREFQCSVVDGHLKIDKMKLDEKKPEEKKGSSKGDDSTAGSNDDVLIEQWHSDFEGSNIWPFDQLPDFVKENLRQAGVLREK